MEISLPYGKETVKFEIPDKYKVHILEGKEHFTPIKNLAEETSKTLQAPTESMPLRKLAMHRKNAVIMVPDITRVTPSKILVPQIIKELTNGGIPNDNITIIIAKGLHRDCTQKELKELLGEEIVENFEVVNHNAYDQENLVYIGTTSVGNRVFINREVYYADLKIGVGSILPHIIAGYTGGRKIILPGVSGAETTSFNHGIDMVRHPNVGFCRVEGNPVHIDMMEAAKLAKLDFIVNTLHNAKGEVVKVVAGDYKEAWLEGVSVAEGLYTTPIQERADILILSGGGYPDDINLFQTISKAIQANRECVKENGVIIVVTKCEDGIGSDILYKWLKNANTPEEVIQRGEREGIKPDGSHVAWFFCYRILSKYKVILVSDLPRNVVEDMFLIPSSSLEEAFEIALSIIKKDSPTIFVNTHGGKLVPIYRADNYEARLS